jgi:hypothetical protein
MADERKDLVAELELEPADLWDTDWARSGSSPLHVG